MKLARLNEDFEEIMGDDPLPDEDRFEPEGMILAREIREYLNAARARINPWIAREFNTYYPEEHVDENDESFLLDYRGHVLDDTLWNMIPHEMQYSAYDAGKTMITVADNILVMSTLETPGIWTIESPYTHP